MPERTASAVWKGGLKSGSGTFSAESGKLGGDYSFDTRFGDKPGSNPEEMLAAAESACFSMALGLNLEKNGTPAERIETSSTCHIGPEGAGFRIDKMKLTVRAKVPGVDAATFRKLAEATREGCPVSQALKGNVQLEMDAALL